MDSPLEPEESYPPFIPFDEAMDMMRELVHPNYPDTWLGNFLFEYHENKVSFPCDLNS
jgi:hypothetical protein